MEKAYIDTILDKYTYKIRIPRFNNIDKFNSTVIDNLPTAIVCALPGLQPHYELGDLVWVDFIRNLFSQPVILGRVYSDRETESLSLTYIDNNTHLSLTIEDTINHLTNKVKELENRIDLLENRSSKGV